MTETIFDNALSKRWGIDTDCFWLILSPEIVLAEKSGIKKWSRMYLK